MRTTSELLSESRIAIQKHLLRLMTEDPVMGYNVDRRRRKKGDTPVQNGRRKEMLPQAVIIRNGHRLLQEMNQVQAKLQCIGVRCGQGFDEVSDVVDRANHMVEMCIDLAVHDLYQQKSRQIEQAWARFHNGQYGICESCGAQIDPDRLGVMPHATTCVSCQRRKEAAK